MLRLNSWLLTQDGFRGRVRVLERPPAAGTLGASLDAVMVAVSSGLTSSAAFGALIAWLKTRPGKLTMRVKKPDGTEIEIEAEGLRGLSAAQLAAYVESIQATASSDPTS
ncbi:hypothetical protein BOX37_06030 [Nocardia mangyaensis]|uniref:Uncharacterized protein n=1 Tax=Nocardia mangyaensis TaxID=2213200 RepID=A0A1J0W164_9NOCA|nr:hypothetical protein BOX37_06030 [Nocardia mangyaensis]